MDYSRANIAEKRKVLTELNALDTRSRLGFSNAPGMPNTKFAFYQSEDECNQYDLSEYEKASCKEHNQQENIIDLSRVKKEPRVNIHKLEKKKEPSPPFDSQNNEKSSPKRKKVENTQNDSSFDADAGPLNDTQDTRLLWDENAAFGDLTPTLTDLIFRPRPNKICRPPNAFMLFAKEHRRQVGMENPEETNRKISILLGNMWRDLSDEDKMKYYKEAQALEKLHKETYPTYVYSPTEARMRKQSRAERKQKLKDTPLSSKTLFGSEDGAESPQNAKDIQEMSIEAVGDKENKNSNENNGQEEKHPTQEKFFCPPMNPFYHPLYFPYPYRPWPVIGSRMPGRSMCTPHCNCPYHGCNKVLPTSQSNLTSKGNQQGLPTASFGSSRPFIPFPSPTYPFSSRPMIPENFHPLLWNPWLLWPGAFYCPPPMSSMEELQKHCQRIRMAHPIAQEKPCASSSARSRTESKSQHGETRDSDDEDGFRPLVIDDGKNSRGCKD